jgi:transposase-like protein
MCSQHSSGTGQSPNRTELDELIAALEKALAALDAAGENIAAAHVDMARNVLLSRKP